MLLIRPSSADDCISIISKTLKMCENMVCEECPRHNAVCAGILRLHDSNFFEVVMRPLYTANAWTKIAFHSLIPTISQKLLNVKEIDALFLKESERSVLKMDGEFSTMMSKLRDACDVHSVRCQTEAIDPNMIEMRRGISEFYADPVVYLSIRNFFGISGVVRIAFHLMIDRLSESLHKDTKIKVTTDVPLAFGAF